ncbi:MAG TPA: hypothetical protein VGJ14_08495 [Sporichthyaceae bacterium]|jgi:hypothetical protein
MGAEPPVGYRIALPPGWARIPLRWGTDEAIAAIADAVFGDPLVDDQLTARRAAAIDEVHKAAVAARDGRGVHLYLPISDIHGLIVPASFVVADVAFGSPDPLDPALLISRLAADPGAKRVRIDGVPGTRTESAASADPGRGTPLPSRRIDYVMPFPDDPDRWLAVTFSVLQPVDGAGDLSSTWIEMFDAMMTTFRWTHATA